MLTEPALAEDAEETGPDRYDLHAESKTYLRLFQRSLLPGAGGAQVETRTLLPAYEYVTLRALDVDGPWQRDSVDVELSAWGSALLVGSGDRDDASTERFGDGDVTIANVRMRWGPASLRAGRQIVVAGASRFSQIDGASAALLSDFGLGVDAYAGLTVLPRWDDRPGYYHLGSAADSLLRQPDALPEPSRSENWMFGGRLHYTHDSLGGLGVSYHDQVEDSELGRRDVGLDATLTPISELAVSADGYIDTDSSKLAEGRAHVAAFPSKQLDVVAEYRRAEPALLLSRQSVLSVFSTDRFDEVGGEIGYRPTSRIGLGTAAFVEVFGGDERGARVSVKGRVVPDLARRLTLLLALSRVSETENGYWSGRGSLRYRVVDPAWLTLEHYTYVYDTPIRGIGTSTVESANAEWAATEELSLLVGSSVVRSPYAALDVQALLRATYAFDVAAGGAR